MNLQDLYKKIRNLEEKLNKIMCAITNSGCTTLSECDCTKLPITVYKYEQINKQGIFYLAQDDGQHKKGFYRKLKDGTILYDAEQVQADMIEIDKTKPSYVKNKNTTLIKKSDFTLDYTYNDKTIVTFTNIKINVNNLEYPFSVILRAYENASITVNFGTYQVNMFRDNPIENKDSAIIELLPDGKLNFV